MPRLFRVLLVAFASLCGASLAIAVAWTIDMRSSDGQVLRNTSLGERPVGGLTEGELEPIVADVANEFEGAEVRVVADGTGFFTDAATLGVSVAEPATREALLQAGRNGNVAARVTGWLRSFVDDRTVDARVRVDRTSVYRTVRQKDTRDRKEPVEPRIVLEDGRLAVAEGEPGEGIDAADVIAAIPDAAAGRPPYLVEVERGDVEPQWDEADIEALIAKARTTVDTAVKVEVGAGEGTVPPATARSWLRSEADDEGVRLVVDQEAAVAGLRELFLSAGRPAKETTFTVDGGTVRIIPGEPGTQCCDDTAASLLEARLLEEGAPAGALVLPMTARPPDLTVEDAQALGVRENVGVFSTGHPAGQPRVQNIHRIADIVQGRLIRPGGKLSINDLVGRRTKDKGFVAAPVIEEGRFSEDVGGGISQFATTLFNAAFFAGLEFGEYQSHSIYISRYPYGREATLSYPNPDLVIENPTPYGVLVWPTYNPTSITVTLYSTKHVEGTQTGQSKAQRGNCTRVTTERTRRWLADGRTEVDRVYATYRPKEGVNC